VYWTKIYTYGHAVVEWDNNRVAKDPINWSLAHLRELPLSSSFASYPTPGSNVGEGLVSSNSLGALVT
jgi:hypothetical protein